MNNFDLNSILSQIGKDKGIDKKVLIEAVESAMLSAARKHYGHSLNLEARFNEDSGEIEVVQFRVVVDEVQDPGTQVSVEEARAEYDSEAMTGDELGKKLDTTALGRIAAQTAKQVIIQKFRDAERGVIFEEYKNTKGELINGIVQRYDRGNVIVNLGRTEAVLPKREQIARERYRQGDRIRCMILDIDPSARGPQIILTRSHPDFLRKLFALEVPEIADQTIEIREVAREPGERAKIAVVSKDSDIDPVGACVGVKGSRVQAVVQELKGERIDIITFSPDAPSFVAKALQPAEVLRVLLDEDEHSMEVVVADDQLAQAIGRRGQNVKLASRLTGWRIDVRSTSVVEEQSRIARQALESIPGIEFTQAERLFQNGFRGVRDVAEAGVSELLELDGFDADSAAKIVAAAREIYNKMEADANTAGTPSPTDLAKLTLGDNLRQRIMSAGIMSIQELVSLPTDQLMARVGLSEEEVQLVRQATDTFFRRPGRENIRDAGIFTKKPGAEGSGESTEGMRVRLPD